MSDDYRVQLDIYNGPLDLLLYLIRREEVDIYDIPIAKITDQYVSYVEVLRQIDPNAAGEFLVLAAMLMEIKSRMLLPRQPVEGEEEIIDPRLELVRQLLEYKKFKDAADQLQSAIIEQSQRYPRQPAGLSGEEHGHIDLDSVHLWDLVEAFRDVMTKTGQFFHEITYDDTPIALHAADILDRLQRDGGSMVFVQIFEGRTRSECIGLFLALLELVRQRRIRAEQEVPFGPIYIHLLDATPIEEPRHEESILTGGAAAGGVSDLDSESGNSGPQPRQEHEEIGSGVGPAGSTHAAATDRDADLTYAVPQPDEEMPPSEYAEEDDDLGPMPEVPELPDDWANHRVQETPEQPHGAGLPQNDAPAEPPPPASSGK
jgi:segregation and condensation protein A